MTTTSGLMCIGENRGYEGGEKITKCGKKEETGVRG